MQNESTNLPIAHQDFAFFAAASLSEKKTKQRRRFVLRNATFPSTPTTHVIRDQSEPEWKIIAFLKQSYFIKDVVLFRDPNFRQRTTSLKNEGIFKKCEFSSTISRHVNPCQSELEFKNSCISQKAFDDKKRLTCSNASPRYR